MLNQFEMERNDILSHFGLSYSHQRQAKGAIVIEYGQREEGNVERERSGRRKRRGELRPFFDFMMSTGIIPGMDVKTGHVVNFTVIDEQYWEKTSLS